MEEILVWLKDLKDLLEKSLRRSEDQGKSMANLMTAVSELIATKKHLVSLNAIEAQTVTVIRRLTDKWHETIDEMKELREQVEHLTQSSTHMGRAFELLYEKIHDKCNPPIERRPEKGSETHDRTV